MPKNRVHLIACRATAAMLPLGQGSAQIASFLLDVRPPPAEATLLYVCSTAGGLHMGQATRSLAELHEVEAEVKQVGLRTFETCSWSCGISRRHHWQECLASMFLATSPALPPVSMLTADNGMGCPCRRRSRQQPLSCRGCSAALLPSSQAQSGMRNWSRRLYQIVDQQRAQPQQHP